MASLDHYADQYIQSSELEKAKMLTDKHRVKWTVMQVRQQEVLDFYFSSREYMVSTDLQAQYKTIKMGNHEWLMRELNILMQNAEAKSFMEAKRQACFKEVKRYMVLKQLKEADSIAAQSLQSIFQRQSFKLNAFLGKADEQIAVGSSCSYSSESSELSSTLSGIDNDFWNSKTPQCCVCYLFKADLPEGTEMYACKQTNGHFTCETCFKAWREANEDTNQRIRLENPYARAKPLKCPQCRVEISHSRRDLIRFGQLKQRDDQRELNQIVQNKIHKKEQLRE